MSETLDTLLKLLLLTVLVLKFVNVGLAAFHAWLQRKNAQLRHELEDEAAVAK